MFDGTHGGHDVEHCLTIFPNWFCIFGALHACRRRLISTQKSNVVYYAYTHPHQSFMHTYYGFQCIRCAYRFHCESIGWEKQQPNKKNHTAFRSEAPEKSQQPPVNNSYSIIVHPGECATIIGATSIPTIDSNGGHKTTAIQNAPIKMHIQEHIH